MKDGQPRRYARVSLKQSEGRWCVLLDDAPATLEGVTLAHSNKPLMETIAQEWQAQETSLRLSHMPATRLLCALHQMTDARADEMRCELLAYSDHDALCYHALGTERELAERQQACWQPWLDWAGAHFGHRLTVVHGIAALTHPPALHQAIARWLEALLPDRLLACYVAAQALGSFILAAALVEGEITPHAATEAGWLESDVQVARWGSDPALEAQRATCLAQVRSAALMSGTTG